LDIPRPSNTQTNTHKSSTERSTRRGKSLSTEELLSRLGQSKTHPRNTRKRAWEQKQAAEKAEFERRAELKRREQEKRRRDQRKRNAKEHQRQGTNWKKSKKKSNTNPKQPKSEARVKQKGAAVRASTAEMFANFEEQWLRFQDSVTERVNRSEYIGLNEIPWPELTMIEELMEETQSPAELTKLYHKLSRMLHPDKLTIKMHLLNGEASIAAERKACEIFQFISNCYQRLK